MNSINGKILNPIIDFNIIVNTDIGLIRFIRENFQDDDAFHIDIINKSDREILSLLYSRINPNPLSIISNEKYMNDIDDLYTSFFANFKNEIIKKSLTSINILKFVKMMVSGSPMGINASICVHDDIEKKQIISHINTNNFVYYNDTNNILLKDAYYVKDFIFFTKNKIENNVLHKKIYTLPTLYNKNYFTEENNILTTTNQIILIGKNYTIKENDDD